MRWRGDIDLFDFGVVVYTMFGYVGGR